MQRPAGSRLDLTLAREVAVRDGVKAVLDGDVSAIGPTYVLSVRLVSADSGQELAAFRASADDAKGIIPAVDKLSKQLRAKIGESLRAVRTSKPLEQVTTGSLEALAKYSQAERAINVDGDYIRGLVLLQEAIALDTSFAMAYRKLGVVLINTNGPPEQRAAALEKAFAHSDRLPDAERYLTIGTYYMSGPTRDPAKALAAYEALLEIQPDNYAALNNASLILRSQGELAKSVEYARRAVAADSANTLAYVNLVTRALRDGADRGSGTRRSRSSRRARRAIRRCRSCRWASGWPTGSTTRRPRSSAQVRGDEEGGPDAAVAGGGAARGDRAGARPARRRRRGTTTPAPSSTAQRGFASALLAREMTLAYYDAWYRGQGPRAVQRLDAALARYPLKSLPALERPYINLAYIYAIAGRPDRARAVLAEQEKELPPDVVASARYDRHNALRGDRARGGEGRPRAHRVPPERRGGLPDLPAPVDRARLRSRGKVRLGDRRVGEVPRHAVAPAREPRPVLPRRDLPAARRAVPAARRHVARGVELRALRGGVARRRPRSAAEGRRCPAAAQVARAHRGRTVTRGASPRAAPGSQWPWGECEQFPHRRPAQLHLCRSADGGRIAVRATLPVHRPPRPRAYHRRMLHDHQEHFRRRRHRADRRRLLVGFLDDDDGSRAGTGARRRRARRAHRRRRRQYRGRHRSSPRRSW